MKTETLIEVLVRGSGPVDRRVVPRRFAAACVVGVAGALLLLFVLLGVNPDLAKLLTVPGFWVKISFTVALAGAAFAAVARLARPGVQMGLAVIWIAVPVLAIWLLALANLVLAAPEARLPLLLGATWRTCPISIGMMSLPAFIAIVWAFRGLAPTALRRAGAAAGLTAGALGAAVYGLHCPELAAPFLAVWYVIGIALPAIMGALLGPQLLRW